MRPESKQCTKRMFITSILLKTFSDYRGNKSVFTDKTWKRIQ